MAEPLMLGARVDPTIRQEFDVLSGTLSLYVIARTGGRYTVTGPQPRTRTASRTGACSPLSHGPCET